MTDGESELLGDSEHVDVGVRELEGDGDAEGDGATVSLLSPLAVAACDELSDAEAELLGEKDADGEVVLDAPSVCDALLLLDKRGEAEASTVPEPATVGVGSSVDSADRSLVDEAAADAVASGEPDKDTDAEPLPDCEALAEGVTDPERDTDGDPLSETHTVEVADAADDSLGEMLEEAVATCDVTAGDCEPVREPEGDPLGEMLEEAVATCDVTAGD